MRKDMAIPEDEEMREGEFVVDVKQFIKMTAGRLNFDDDSILRMISYKHDKAQDFLCTANNQHFRIPVARLNQFFMEYEKPEQPMSLEAENAALKAKLRELEKLVGDKKPEGKKKFVHTPPEFAEHLKKETEEEEEEPVKKTVAPKKKTIKKKKPAKKLPNRVAPLPQKPKAPKINKDDLPDEMDADDIAKMLGKELKDKQSTIGKVAPTEKPDLQERLED